MGHSGPPPGGGGEQPGNQQKHKSGHVAYRKKALEKLYSIMPIKCSFDPLFVLQAAENDLKITFLMIVLLREHLHTK